MKRTILLSVLLCAITAAAALLGWERQLSQAGGFAERVPIEAPESAAQRESEPEPAPEPEAAADKPSGQQPPRFVYDEPLPEPAVPEPAVPEDEAPAESGPAASEAPSETPFAQEGEVPSIVAVTPEQEGRPPTAAEVSEAASGHLRELEALLSRITASLDTLAQQAMTDYRMLPDPNDETQLGALIERYLPSLYALEQEADAEAAVILENLEAALLSIGADTSLAAQKRLDYEAAKAAQLGYYKELAAAYVRQSAGA